MTRIMYDSTNVGDIPSNAKMVAVYADGRYSATEAAARRRFPKAAIVRITVGTQPGRHVCDCETGDATPTEAAKWAKAEVAAGRHPTIYCNASTWPSVRAACAAINLHDSELSYWIAEYDGKAVIPAGAVAKQYEGSPGNSPGHYDVSIVADYWPGVDPKPAPKPANLTGWQRKLEDWLHTAATKRAKNGRPLSPPAKARTKALIKVLTEMVNVK